MAVLQTLLESRGITALEALSVAAFRPLTLNFLNDHRRVVIGHILWRVRKLLAKVIFIEPLAIIVMYFLDKAPIWVNYRASFLLATGSLNECHRIRGALICEVTEAFADFHLVTFILQLFKLLSSNLLLLLSELLLLQ